MDNGVGEIGAMGKIEERTGEKTAEEIAEKTGEKTAEEIAEKMEKKAEEIMEEKIAEKKGGGGFCMGACGCGGVTGNSGKNPSIVVKEEHEAGEFPEEKFEELGNFIDSLPSKEGALIQVLYKAQELFGYLPREVQLFVARKLGVPGAAVTGVVTFYSYFTTEKRGKHLISVCMGTACFVKGSEKLLARLKSILNIDCGQTTPDGMYTLEEVRCLGACGLAPVLTVDGKVYGNVREEDIGNIIDITEA